MRSARSLRTAVAEFRRLARDGVAIWALLFVSLGFIVGATATQPLAPGQQVALFVLAAPGAVAMLVLSAHVTGTDVTQRSLPAVLVRESRGGRLMTVRVVSLAIGALVGFLGAAAVASVISPFVSGEGAGGIPSLLRQDFWMRIIIATVVIGCYATVGGVAALIARSTIGGLFWGLAWMTADVGICALEGVIGRDARFAPGLTPLTVTYNVASIAGPAAQEGLWLWLPPDLFCQALAPPWMASVYLLLVSGTGLWFAGRLVRRAVL